MSIDLLCLSLFNAAISAFQCNCNVVIFDFLCPYREQTLDSTSDPKKKPTKPEMIEKIVAGKVAKRLNEISLLGQAHLTEEGGPVIKKFLETYSAANKTDVKIDSFVRWTLGQEE